MPYHTLDWDTEHFEYIVALISESTSLGAVAGTFKQIKSAGVCLAYWLTDMFAGNRGKLEHKLQANQVEHIKNQKIYSHLFTSPQFFTRSMYTCKNGKKAFAVIDITSIYK